MDLYLKGLKLEKIAEARSVKIETIIDHIAYLIEKKILPIENVDKLVKKETKEKVIKSVEKVGKEKLKAIFDDLNNEVDYRDIKIVVAGLNRS